MTSFPLGAYALERDHANLRLALDWLLDHGETETALELGGVLSPSATARSGRTDCRPVMPLLAPGP
ncbi:MAG: hypothetical protein M3069_28930 [Chloroflexota bacterium]|nr:hypothetical protein [Chloroflexota bacterium]